MFLVYNLETTVVMHTRGYLSEFKTLAAARAFLTRMVKMCYRREDFAVAEAKEFYATIEKTRVVKNLMTGVMTTESANTPNCCSVGSESYWSM